MRVRPGGSAGRPVPWQLLVVSGLTWLALLPVSVLLSDDTGFGRRLLYEVVAAVVGTAFAVLVGGLVIDAWKAREQRAVAARQAAGWDLEHARLLGAALESARQQVAGTVATCYRLVRELAVEPDGPDPSEIADAFRDPAVGDSRELADALAESRRLYGAVLLLSDDRTRVLLDAGPRRPGVAPDDWDPAAVDAVRLPAFLQRAAEFGAFADRRLGEVEQGLTTVLDATGEDDPQLLLLAHQLRAAASVWWDTWTTDLYEFPADVSEGLRAKDLVTSLGDILRYGADLAARLTERAQHWSEIFDLDLEDFLGRTRR